MTGSTDTITSVHDLEDIELFPVQSENNDSSNGFLKHFETTRTPEQRQVEKKLVRKIDFMILPLLSMTTFLASLDKGDIGYAYNAGLKEELNITADQLSTISAVFYVGHLLLQFPASLFLKRITAGTQISLALVVWGTFTTVMCTAKNWETLAGFRVLIGAGEAFNSVATLYLTFLYRRDELATRGSIYYAVTALSGSFNGILGYGIVKNLNNVRGWLAWRWVFLIEGLMAVAFAPIIHFCLPASPDKFRKGFSVAEREMAVRRYNEAFNVVGDAKVRPGHIWKVLKDPSCWIYVVIACATNASIGAFSTFLPVIVKQFGYSTLSTNLLTIPVWVATGVMTIGCCLLSDRLKQRGWLIMLCFTIASVGYIVLLTAPSKGAGLTAVFLVGIGTFPTTVLYQVWFASNILGYTKRASLYALTSMIGQVFAIASQKAYNGPPHYYAGHGFVLGMMVFGVIASGIQIRVLMWKNAKKLATQGSQEAKEKRALGVEEINEEHPDFMYYL
ncbi:putative pantothenate transporter [Microthyrium microscopicum]|uniref:Putative pantothenate transporter n=1 Tax=Microthyrium microscopicum TaxID=703497 RepID=A0A6A6UDP9_9PEZI|nr:putative pantothenate transporter [Microthyrium microscopicum]